MDCAGLGAGMLVGTPPEGVLGLESMLGAAGMLAMDREQMDQVPSKWFTYLTLASL